MTADLDAALDRIRDWTRAALGRDTLIPAPAVAGSATAGRSPVVGELASLFVRAETALPTLLPSHDLLTAARSVQVQTMWLDIGADQRARFPEFAAFDPAAERRRPAGSAGELFLPEFVPIADRDASTLFLDTRPGEHHGCVSEYSATGAGSGPWWPSMSAMFTALADSLTTGAPFLRHRPRVKGGGLRWLPA